MAKNSYTKETTLSSEDESLSYDSPDY